MRRIVCVVVCALAAACGGSDSRRLVLLHTNDEHSHLLGFGPEADEFPIVATRTGTGSIVGGASRRSTILAQERQKAKNAGADSLTVSAGDNLIGSLAQLRATVNAPDYKVMSLLGYDVTTLGNHEFDFGPDTLAQVINAATAAGAKVPIVSSNIHFSGNAGALDAPLKALFDETGKSATAPVHRYLVLTTPQRLKVGFVGSPETLSTIAEIAADYPDVPVVSYMPALSWWDEGPTDMYEDAFRELMLPQTTVLDGNHSTLWRWLLPEWNNERSPTARDIAKAASDMGVPYTLVTGVPLPDQFVENVLATPQAVLTSARTTHNNVGASSGGNFRSVIPTHLRWRKPPLTKQCTVTKGQRARRVRRWRLFRRHERARRVVLPLLLLLFLRRRCRFICSR